MIDVTILKRIPLFAGLEVYQLETLRGYLRREEYQKGNYILREQTTGDLMYLLVDGEAVVTKDLVMGFEQDQASTEKVLHTLKSDKLPTFGENGILGHAPRNANVIAQSDCVVYTLSKTDFDDFAVSDYKGAYFLMLNIARVISMRLNLTDVNVVKLATALYIAAQKR